MEVTLALDTLYWLYKEQRETFIQALKWTANVFIILPAVIITVSIAAASQIFPFALFMLGHILWAWFGFLCRDKPLIWLNVGLMPVDIYAIAIRT